jgi:hypothetical protein
MGYGRVVAARVGGGRGAVVALGGMDNAGQAGRHAGGPRRTRVRHLRRRGRGAAPERGLRTTGSVHGRALHRPGLGCCARGDGGSCRSRPRFTSRSAPTSPGRAKPSSRPSHGGGWIPSSRGHCCSGAAGNLGAGDRARQLVERRRARGRVGSGSLPASSLLRPHAVRSQAINPSGPLAVSTSRRRRTCRRRACRANQSPSGAQVREA